MVNSARFKLRSTLESIRISVVMQFPWPRYFLHAIIREESYITYPTSYWNTKVYIYLLVFTRNSMNIRETRLREHPTHATWHAFARNITCISRIEITRSVRFHLIVRIIGRAHRLNARRCNRKTHPTHVGVRVSATYATRIHQDPVMFSG